MSPQLSWMTSNLLGCRICFDELFISQDWPDRADPCARGTS